MLSYEAELRDHARRLFEDTGPLHTVALLGFDESEPAVVDACLDVLARGQGRWTFLDLRALSADAAREALRPHVGDDALVLVTRHENVPQPITNFVRAIIDHSPRFDLGDYVEIPRRSDQSVVVVVHGASTHDELPAELRRIPYEDLIP
ncbi:hypothetical protein L6R52_15660 [Myxococcota bacterium]|nr:hypothetical protein [Myxococcota bacterium]